MNHNLFFAIAALALSATLRAQAQPSPSPSLTSQIQIAPAQWQPAISVSTSARGLALRSQPIAALEPNREPDPNAQAAPAGASVPGEPGAQSSPGERGSRLGRALSDSIGPFGIATGVFLLADGKNHPGQTRGAIEGVGATALVTTLLKYVVHERRPNGNPHSFPSGHASAAFAFATAASYNHHNLRLPLFALATAIAASRVDVRAHYAHDVIAGAALGYGITRYFMRRSDRGVTLSSAAHGGVSFARSF